MVWMHSLGSHCSALDVFHTCIRMQKNRGAYTAKALHHLVTASPAVAAGGEERRMLCLIDRFLEPLVRAHWAELLEQPEDPAQQEASLVHNLPFAPRAIDRSKRSRRRGNATKQ